MYSEQSKRISGKSNSKSESILPHRLGKANYMYIPYDHSDKSMRDVNNHPGSSGFLPVASGLNNFIPSGVNLAASNPALIPQYHVMRNYYSNISTFMHPGNSGCEQRTIVPTQPVVILNQVCDKVDTNVKIKNVPDKFHSSYEECNQTQMHVQFPHTLPKTKPKDKHEFLDKSSKDFPTFQRSSTEEGRGILSLTEIHEKNRNVLSQKVQGVKPETRRKQTPENPLRDINTAAKGTKEPPYFDKSLKELPSAFYELINISEKENSVNCFNKKAFHSLLDKTTDHYGSVYQDLVGASGLNNPQISVASVKNPPQSSFVSFKHNLQFPLQSKGKAKSERGNDDIASSKNITHDATIEESIHLFKLTMIPLIASKLWGTECDYCYMIHPIRNDHCSLFNACWKGLDRSGFEVRRRKVLQFV